LDLHEGFGAQGWIHKPHVWGRLVITIFTLKKEVVAFGGTLEGLADKLSPLSTWKLAFGGLGINHLAHDIMEETTVRWGRVRR
jgi:hypothetical protein